MIPPKWWENMDMCDLCEMEFNKEMNRPIDRYPEFVKSVMGPGCDTIEYAGLAIPGEAGEFADYIKKVKFHGIEMDISKLRHEAADVLWGLQAFCLGQGIRLEDLMEMNMEKLSARYPNGFVPGGGIR
jgi:NTP pyrophosphatase (non-canonical NTP hydrolase)